MKLCECGCGKEVKSLSVRFLPGHHNRSPEVKERKRQAMLLRYGVDNPSKCKEFQDKKISTSIENWGVSSPNQSESVKGKKKQVCLDRYGVENPNQLESIKEQKVKTCRKHFGVDYPSQSEEVNQKKIDSYIKNYGSEHPMLNDEFVENLKGIFLEKYGVENPSQIGEVKKRKIELSYEKYGVAYFSQTYEGRKICRESFIKTIEKQRLNGEPLVPRIGQIERECLNELQTLFGYGIKRNKQIIGYFPDGYIGELNLVIEFDEVHHQYNYQKIRDIQKDLDYHVINLNVVRITEKQWKENKEETIQNFLCVIRGLEDIKRLQDTL
jgi:very-short-patch-repair endonuclease